MAPIPGWEKEEIRKLDTLSKKRALGYYQPLTKALQRNNRKKMQPVRTLQERTMDGRWVQTRAEFLLSVPITEGLTAEMVNEYWGMVNEYWGEDTQVFNLAIF